MAAGREDAEAGSALLQISDGGQAVSAPGRA